MNRRQLFAALFGVAVIPKSVPPQQPKPLPPTVGGQVLTHDTFNTLLERVNQLVEHAHFQVK
jgi:hypothetical protein